MEKRDKDFYVKKFKSLSEEAKNADLDRTIEIVTISTLKAIVSDSETFEKFLDFENNLEYFQAWNEACLIDFVADLKAYSEYMIESGSKIAPEVLDRMHYFTEKEPNDNRIEAHYQKELSNFSLSLLKNFDELSEFLKKEDSEIVDGFVVEDIKTFLAQTESLKTLMHMSCFKSDVLNNYSFFQDFMELKDYEQIPKDMTIDSDLEKTIMSKFTEKKPNVLEITTSIKQTIEELGYESGLVKFWKPLTAYFLEKYGIDAYFKSDAEEDSIVYFEGAYKRVIQKPKEFDESYRSSELLRKYEELASSSYLLPEDSRMDPNLENLVMSEVTLVNNPVVDAFNIYNALNKHLQYSSSMFALDQDKSSAIIQAVYNKSIDQYDVENNSVTCKNWSEMYAYLCSNYAGCMPLINKEGWHKNVSLVISDNIITADATNVSSSIIDGTRMTDLTRAKLGLIPAGFTPLFSVPELEREKKKFKRYDENEMILECSQYAEQADVKELMDILGNENLQDRVLNLRGMGTNEKVIRKLSYINQLLGLANMRNVDVTAYLSKVLTTVLTAEEMDKVRMHNKLYSEFDENFECQLHPMISINVSSPEAEEKFFYLIHDGEKGFCRISREEILEKVSEGKFKVMMRGKTIPGIPELSSTELFEQYEANKKVEQAMGNNTIPEGDSR